MTKLEQSENGHSPLEDAQQLATKLRNELPTESDSSQRHLSVDNLDAVVIPPYDADTYAHGHVIIVGGSTQVRAVFEALRLTDLFRRYDISIFTVHYGSLQRQTTTPPWQRGGSPGDDKYGVDTFVREERKFRTESQTAWKEVYSRYAQWYQNITGDNPPSMSKVASVFTPSVVRTHSDGSTEKQVVWTDR